LDILESWWKAPHLHAAWLLLRSNARAACLMLYLS
jgi:hypothetical protein